ncbi:hypothetical protein TNCV_3042861 [Trichonephila clavipes]|nr:hypothetical protein TNCV_3042861 [Trichonephila clavipes]
MGNIWEKHDFMGLEREKIEEVQMHGASSSRGNHVPMVTSSWPHGHMVHKQVNRISFRPRQEESRLNKEDKRKD